ncbi:ferrous iron transport protein B [Corynebacterium pseudopelargi]|uniref:Ferrous iron transport protein B n=1 Tax=Corynebacterium pseudopelargi TaxID=2080757 RepID=A0A3G6ISL8_9CORY|nr:ferrous iron transport protein B [Corynebacterium pseudopelargi]AZA08645.1 Ferrous iron transport protein B [Corynebacterium pseudopelargi]
MSTSTCHCESHGSNPAPKGAPIIALVGAPNAGKSTLFNGLTGAKAKMGNWPGTTVEVSRGAWRTKDGTYDVIDFPGAYSLDPISPDEELTRELVVECAPEDRPDLVLVAVDATALSRSLYMVAQLAEQDHRIVVVVTKADVAARYGSTADIDKLAEMLGVPVLAVDPRRRSNLAAIEKAVAKRLEQPKHTLRETSLQDTFELADARFAWVETAVAAALDAKEQQKRSATEKIDAVALHPVFGPLLFLACMWLVFQITTTVAAPLQDSLESFFSGPVSDAARSFLETIGLSQPFFTGLIVDGLIGGVGMVLTFAPLMALMFLILAVLEDSGYMSRAAVVTDRLMKAIGLPGKAFIPLIVGFGCNVPAISATRVLGQPRQRLLTALLIPFTSCSARLTVYVMLATTFFPDHAGSVVFAMYVISIALVILVGLGMKHTLWRRMGTEPLVIDLPVYQLPGLRLAFSVMWVRLKGFLHTAGGIIVATVTVVFLLQSTPMVGGYGFADEDLPPQDSVYGRVSETIAPVFEPAGFGSWSISGTLLTGFVAKEAVISSWAQTYQLEDVTDEDPNEQASSPLAQAVRQDFKEASGGHTIAAVWAFMIFLLSYTPCVATLAAQKREIGTKWMLFGMVIQLTSAWILAVATFHLLKVWF